ncbi:biotin/lipoyl-binding protein, partial [Salmonella enterica subsp. enterica serovar Weltevreden]|nr:biotin/lipoyl-binding protein [Salmonella enterica subsp. enterica serovar Weltevreden]MCH5988288.1 biotin/lipoyl-binding protein [Salmonella enterica]
AVRKDQGLVTLESDKATMEVPSSVDGVVKELKVKVGDTVSEGAVIAIVEAVGAEAASSPSPSSRGADRGEGAPSPAASPSSPTRAGEGRG